MHKPIKDELEKLIAMGEGFSVEFINSGGLVAGLERKDLGRVSRPRNPLLFSMLERMDLVENIGSGIKRMRDNMKDEGHPLPVVEIGESWFLISFSRPQAAVESRPESRPESRLAGKTLELLRNGAAGKAELAKGVGHKTISGELKKQIAVLLEQGLIEMTIPEKPNSRLQKYRLTEKGKRALKNK